MAVSTSTVRRLLRLSTAVLCAAGYTLAQVVPAEAATVTRSYDFQYRMETRTWKQKRGPVTLTLAKCRRSTMFSSSDHFHVLFSRSRWGRDTRLSDATIRCEDGQRARFDAPYDGEYYFTFSKIDDKGSFSGKAVISYPS